MGKHKQRVSPGFTIIETILFLGVTGALIAGMMFATSMTLGTQRYRDATESFKTLLQQQYASISSVQNSRENDQTCTNQASTADGNVLRGQSDCVLVGRYMVIRGGDVVVYPVLAYEVTPPSGTSNDITTFRNNYRLNLAKSNAVESELEWDARISWATEGNADDRRSPTTPRSIAILFLRSPSSGQIYTFTSNTVPTEAQINGAAAAPAFIRNMVQAGAVVPGQKGRTICLDSGGLTPIPNTSLYIAPYAAGSSGIEVRSNDVSRQLGADERC